MSHLHAHKRGAADPDEKCDGADHRHNGTADTGPGERHIAGNRDVSDIHAVNDAVKNADKLRQHTGDRDADHKFFYIVTAEIIFCCHNYLLMIYSRSKTGCV